MKPTKSPAQELATAKRNGRASHLETEFRVRWSAVDGPELVREFVFHPTRKWRFDFADPVAKVAVEVEGAVWGNGRHNRGSGYDADCEKYNAAARLGWAIFRLTEKGLRNWEQLNSIVQAIRERREK